MIIRCIAIDDEPLALCKMVGYTEFHKSANKARSYFESAQHMLLTG
jgi:hypothetical protein